jgi:hypothetical protein
MRDCRAWTPARPRPSASVSRTSRAAIFALALMPWFVLRIVPSGHCVDRNGQCHVDSRRLVVSTSYLNTIRFINPNSPHMDIAMANGGDAGESDVGWHLSERHKLCPGPATPPVRWSRVRLPRRLPPSGSALGRARARRRTRRTRGCGARARSREVEAEQAAAPSELEAERDRRAAAARKLQEDVTRALSRHVSSRPSARRARRLRASSSPRPPDHVASAAAARRSGEEARRARERRGGTLRVQAARRCTTHANGEEARRARERLAGRMEARAESGRAAATLDVARRGARDVELGGRAAQRRARRVARSLARRSAVKRHAARTSGEKARSEREPLADKMEARAEPRPRSTRLGAELATAGSEGVRLGAELDASRALTRGAAR